jgi:hypothetical protein
MAEICGALIGATTAESEQATHSLENAFVELPVSSNSCAETGTGIEYDPYVIHGNDGRNRLYLKAQHMCWFHRGPHLQNLSPIEYACIITVRKRTKSDTPCIIQIDDAIGTVKTQHEPGCAGRFRNAVFAFSPAYSGCDIFVQELSSRHRVPVLRGTYLTQLRLPPNCVSVPSSEKIVIALDGP